MALPFDAYCIQLACCGVLFSFSIFIKLLLPIKKKDQEEIVQSLPFTILYSNVKKIITAKYMTGTKIFRSHPRNLYGHM